MPKRQTIDSEDDWENEIDSSGDSDFYNASQSGKKRGGRTQSGGTSKKRKTTTQSKLSSQKLEGDKPVSNRHSRSLHTIKSVKELRMSLLQWYQSVHDNRGMPWRKPFDPSLGPADRAQRAYEVWISEIMLQQTQVATVVPYYNRWMSRFPTIRDLAAANLDEVNSLWKGLGYYSRANRLLNGARKAVSELGGQLPDNAKEMEAKIPGIGRYSAGAICSIAYGEEVPVLDGNVHRLLSRFLTLHANPKAKSTLDILWAAAGSLVKVKDLNHEAISQHPGDINQALIELGSTVCKVRDPGCDSCPLKTWCGAYQQMLPPRKEQPNETIGDIEDLCLTCEPISGAVEVTAYPMKAERKKAREEIDIVNVVEWRRSGETGERWFLLVKRPEKGLLAGLYEFTALSDVTGSLTREQQEKIPSDLLAQILDCPVSPLAPPRSKKQSKSKGKGIPCIQIVKVVPVGDVIHVFSHIKKTYRVQWVVLEGGDTTPELKKNVEPGVPSKVSKKRTKKVEPPIDQPSEACPIMDAKWVLLDDVTHENTGTGIVKVWKLTKSLWE